MPPRRLALVLPFVLLVGCTRLKAVTPTPSPSASASADPVAASPSPSPSPSPSALPSPVPTPQPTPMITLVAPGSSQDFGSSAIDIAFTALAPPGRKLTQVDVIYDGTTISTSKDPGPIFKVTGWNPNVVNNLGEKPDLTPQPSGDKTLTILATDDNKQVAKLEFAFRKPLSITGWVELTAMPNATSHFAIFGDGAQPPSFTSLWGSVDGIETTAISRVQSYAFNPLGAGSWTTQLLNGSSIPRIGYGWAEHSSGQLIYAVGGKAGTQDLRTLDVFSPLRKVAEESLAVMTNARRDPAAVYTADGFLYAIGGKSGNTPLYSTERVQIATDGNPTGDWKSLADTQSARAGATAIQSGKQIWLFGGGFRPIEVYDPDANSWTYLTSPDGTVIGTPEAWSNSLMVHVGDRYYFFGGEKVDGQPITNIYEFSPASRAWRTVGPLPTSNQIPADQIAQTRLGGFYADGYFYLVGGQSLPSRKATARVLRGRAL